MPTGRYVAPARNGGGSWGGNAPVGNPITPQDQLAFRQRLLNPNAVAQPPQPAEDPLAALIAQYAANKQKNSIGYGSIYDAGGAIANMFNSRIGGINSAFDQALGAIGTQRDAGANEIVRSHADFNNASNQISADYRGQAAGIDRGIAQHGQQMQQEQAAQANPIMADLAAQGVANGAIGQQLAANQQTAQQGTQLQADLAKRMAQTQEAGTANVMSNAQLVRQGAEGTLANNYSDIVAKIQAEKANQIAAAEQARQEAEMENAARVAAQRTEIEKFNATQAGENDPLKRALMMQQLQAGQLDLEKTKLGMQPDPARSINDARLQDDARMLINAAPDKATAFQSASAVANEKFQGDDENTKRNRDQWLKAIASQLSYYYNPQDTYGPGQVQQFQWVKP